MGICTENGCDRLSRARGLCSLHYGRLYMAGEIPQRQGTKHGEAKRWLLSIQGMNSTECIIWPFCKTHDGYAQVYHQGRMQIVSRIVCERVNGKPPSPRSEAAHSCGNGSIGCVNENHVSWKTPSENAKDKILQGTSGRRRSISASDLKPYQISEIKEKLASGQNPEVVAIGYKLNKECMNDIVHGRVWGWM